MPLNQSSDTFALAAAAWQAVDGHVQDMHESTARSYDVLAQWHEERHNPEKAATCYTKSAEAWTELVAFHEQANHPKRLRLAQKEVSDAEGRAVDLQSAAANAAVQAARRLTNAKQSDAAVFHWTEAASKWRAVGEGDANERKAKAAEAAGAAVRAHIEWERGRLWVAAKFRREAADLYEACGQEEDAKLERAYAAVNLSAHQTEKGKLKEALSRCEEAVGLFRRLDRRHIVKKTEAKAAELATRIALQEGDMKEAAKQGRSQIQKWKTCGEPEKAESARTWLKAIGINV